MEHKKGPGAFLNAMWEMWYDVDIEIDIGKQTHAQSWYTII